MYHCLIEMLFIKKEKSLRYHEKSNIAHCQMLNSSETESDPYRETDRRAGMTSGQLMTTLVTSSANSPANHSRLL